MKITIYLTNLGKYNEGELVGQWVDLPATAEDLAAALRNIGIDGRQYEYFITDYETDAPITIGEYDRLEDLNEMAAELAALDDYTAEIVTALIGDGYSLADALAAADDCLYYDGCSDMTEVAERYADETGLLDSIPENLRYYFDFEAFSRDMELEGHWIPTDGGYIEVLD